MNSGDEDTSNNEIEPEILAAFKHALRHGRHGDGSRSVHSTRHVKIGIQRIGRGFNPSSSSSDLLPIRRSNSELNSLKDFVMELSLSLNRNAENFNSRLERKDKDIDQLKIENAKLQEKVACLEEHTKQCDKENENLKKDLQQLQAQVSKLQDVNDLYQEDIKAMIEERRQRIFKH